MAISKDNIFVQLKYKLYVGNDGEEVMIEETPDDQLFRFTTGLGMVLAHATLVFGRSTRNRVTPYPNHLFAVPNALVGLNGIFQIFSL